MDVIAQNIHLLIPEEKSPCDIFLHFRGQNALALSKGQQISFDFLQKIARSQQLQIYIRKEEQSDWNHWVETRHPLNSGGADSKQDENKIFGNKRAEFISYIQKCIQIKDVNDKTESAYRKAVSIVQKIIQSSMLDWYFNKFHEPPDLFHHNARVCFGLALFYQTHYIVDDNSLEDILFSIIIHELEGDPQGISKTIVSQQTLAILEKNKLPVPKQVIELIKIHDELVSGAGFPNKIKKDEIPVFVKAFTLFNHFDHYRLKATGTRRSRFDAAKKQMEIRRMDYDQELWVNFWNFWEKMECVS